MDYFQNYIIIGEKGFYRFGPSVRYLQPRYLLGEDEQLVYSKKWKTIRRLENYQQE